MPLYRYQCSGCGHEFEELVWTTSVTATEIVCPQCASKSVEKQLPMFGVRTAAPAPKASDAAPFCGRCGEARPPCDS